LKRRAFLAATALLSLFAPSTVLAARKKKAESSAPARATTKSSERSSTRGKGRSGRAESERDSRSSRRESRHESRRERKRNARRNERAAVAEREVVERPATHANPPPSTVDTRSSFTLADEQAAVWRNYELVSSLTINEVRGKLRVWLPLALYRDCSWQRSLGHTWQGNFSNAGIYRDPLSDMELFYADWQDAGTVKPQLQVVSQVARQDRHFDITRRGGGERNEVLRRCLQATPLLPIDGLVRQTAERAIGRIKDPVAQGKAIYDWVIDNSSFDPQAPGIGRGDVEALLDSGRLSGKSADISLLFVALCRSMGIPARPVFGMRVDGSRVMASLGASGNLRDSQHCRAEFYTPGYGWIPVDPSDVRKSIHDERLTGSDSRLPVLRKLLFGVWEANWVALNSALDIRLPGSNERALPFLILPQAIAASERFDSNDTNRFTYTVSASRSAL